MPERHTLMTPPPELRDHPLVRGPQRRWSQIDRLELRAAEPDDGDADAEDALSTGTFVGHAAVFDEWSLPLYDYWMGLFRERIQRGFFRDVLGDDNDCKFLALNHDTNLIVARVGNRTLSLTEDPRGLAVEADLANTAAGRDLATLVTRRDVTQMSFGFDVDGAADAERWDWNEIDEIWERTLIRCARLYDVSAVSFPAYGGTDANMRGLTTICGVELADQNGQVDGARLRDLAWRIHRREVAATAEDRAALDKFFTRTETVSPWMAERALRATAQEPELQAAVPGQKATVTLETAPSGEPAPDLRHKFAARRRRLDLLANS